MLEFMALPAYRNELPSGLITGVFVIALVLQMMDFGGLLRQARLANVAISFEDQLSLMLPDG